MNVSTLSFIITIAGIVFFAISLSIIILGKKVGDGNTPQQIKLGGLDLRTNSIITLLIITAVFSLAPLGLSYWKPDLSNYIHREELSTNYLSLSDLSLNIRGNVIDETGWSNGVKIKVRRTLGEVSKTIEDKTDQMGSFNIDLQNVRPKERYELNLKKDGYEDVLLRFGFLEVITQHKLSKLNN